MKRLLAVGLVLLALGSVAGVSLGGATGPVGQEQPNLLATQEFDSVQFRITVHENGSARWTFQYQRALANDSDREQFQAFADHFNENETDLWSNFQSQAVGLTEAGANATGRDMEAHSFEREATVSGLDGNLGVVRMSFVWANFADHQDGRLVVSDVFEGGLYIGENQSLVVEVGDGLVFAEALPEPKMSSPSSLADSKSIAWEGPHEFSDRRPRVVFEPEPEQTRTPNESGTTDEPPTDTERTTDATTTTAPAEGGSDGWLTIGVGLVVVVGLVAAWLWFGTGDFPPSAGGWFSPGDDGSGGASETAEKPSPPSVPEEELLTDEDRVLKLLESNGGRMKQVNIVEETGWSKSKVSMLLSEMADEGQISKLRMGRENIISLDGHEPEAARSPYEEERPR